MLSYITIASNRRIPGPNHASLIIPYIFPMKLKLFSDENNFNFISQDLTFFGL